MASQQPPPVVDVNTYVAPPATGTCYTTIFLSLQSVDSFFPLICAYIHTTHMFSIFAVGELLCIE